MCLWYTGIAFLSDHALIQDCIFQNSEISNLFAALANLSKEKVSLNITHSVSLTDHFSIVN